MNPIYRQHSSVLPNSHVENVLIEDFIYQDQILVLVLNENAYLERKTKIERKKEREERE